MSEPTTIEDGEQRIELLEERLNVDKRVVTLGRVFVETKVETKQHVVEAILRQDDVDIERVPIGQVVDSAPEIREENGVLIVPVVEEQLVVQVRLVLKEELRVSKTVTSEKVRKAIPLRSEHATITRIGDPDPTTPANIQGNDL